MFTLYATDEPQEERGEYLHMSSARRAAQSLAAALVQPVEIRAGGRARIVVQPDGSARPPVGVSVPERAQHRDDGRPCFCLACRADRREARKASA